jgi:hypothetical protein
MNTPDPTPFHIVEIDDDGWAAFKELEAQHRREYAASAEAIADHQAWVNAPIASDENWSSLPEKEKKVVIIPSRTNLPWHMRYDWALEKSCPRAHSSP